LGASQPAFSGVDSMSNAAVAHIGGS
jgi:hypothetical protein